jgi:hypothetical protein
MPGEQNRSALRGERLKLLDVFSGTRLVFLVARGGGFFVGGRHQVSLVHCSIPRVTDGESAG